MSHAPKPRPLASLLTTMHGIADSTAGPGMSTRIKGPDAYSCVYWLEDLAERLAACENAAAPKPARGKLKEVNAELEDLRSAFRALGEIVENKTPRAKARTPLDALEIWAREHGMADGLPKNWAEAVERALSGGSA